MMNTEKQELLELIAHKLHFLENPIQFVGINNLKPLAFISQDYAKHLKVSDLGAAQPDILPKDAGLVFLQISDQNLSQTLAQLPEIVALPGLQETHAKMQDRVILVDDLVFKKATEIEQLEIMAEVFYPKFFAFGYEGKAWLKLSF